MVHIKIDVPMSGGKRRAVERGPHEINVKLEVLLWTDTINTTLMFQLHYCYYCFCPINTICTTTPHVYLLLLFLLDYFYFLFFEIM